MEEVQAALELQNVSKQYTGTLAVDQVDLRIYPGEVHAIIGENGAGKSTLMNIINGSFTDYTGVIKIHGRPVGLHSPAIAKEQGIAMIHQELCLAPPISIAENILAGRLPTQYGFLSRKKMVQEATRLLREVGLHLNPLTPVSEISQHQAQLVEIAKALGNEPSILIMDEPTSALSSEEVSILFDIVQNLKRQGLAILYISHHLPEIMQIADRITIMRDGGKVDTVQAKETSPAQLIEMMLGQKVQERKSIQKNLTGPVRFRVQQGSRFGFFHDIRFEIRSGEILGLGGLAGSGRSEIARSLCGIDPLDQGQVYLNDTRLELRDMRSAMRHGLAYVSEDRKREGLAVQLTALGNLLSAKTNKESRYISTANGTSLFLTCAQTLALYPMEPHRQVAQYSGGNQQKILLGKWLQTEPEVLILDEPTRGVDIGAKNVIHETISRLANQGMCILLISSDIPELIHLSDRVLIIRKGHGIREMRKQDLSEEAVLLAMNGE